MEAKVAILGGDNADRSLAGVGMGDVSDARMLQVPDERNTGRKSGLKVELNYPP